ncbi:DUF928 domain-containing protein [Anabaena cylindrica FACHB-243]|nr:MULTISPECIES: DUF928 domain-containing protein [Anabaena]MBD2419535.1 DUF928 domain-containing protein [Anabaena cylindrica FACHB-243]MBY5282767.1 DUF928 domain-containing protein [Anabaena sp. CCAP 1446/1C]MBY5309104.1 DUF928 domain-containing protein [Anabaena sp. CCAP 1446/1C]MCM2409729.1 DUF928 domain-containing protein [Anabaena sp. CCAP 1446/1C]
MKYKFISFSWLMLALGFFGFNYPSFAQTILDYKPPKSEDEPPPTKPLGTRPGCKSEQMTAFKPKYDLGLTINERPTFWVYVPYSAKLPHSARLIIWNGQQNKVYETSFQLKNTPGIIGVRLPENAPNLVSGKTYGWDFWFSTDENNCKYYVNWWIKRVQVSDDLEKKINQAKTVRDRLIIYAEYGVWHDLFTDLAELYRIQPQNPQVQADWKTLLRDKDVDLDKFISEPIVK